MSVHFVVFGERRIQFERSNGQASTEMQTLRIDTLRLGTEISEKLFNSGDTDDLRIAAYIDHVTSHVGKKIQTVAVYAPGTDARDGYPLDFRQKDVMAEHLKEFTTTVQELRSRGFKINAQIC